MTLQGIAATPPSDSCLVLLSTRAFEPVTKQNGFISSKDPDIKVTAECNAICMPVSAVNAVQALTYTTTGKILDRKTLVDFVNKIIFTLEGSVDFKNGIPQFMHFGILESSGKMLGLESLDPMAISKPEVIFKHPVEVLTTVYRVRILGLQKEGSFHSVLSLGIDEKKGELLILDPNEGNKIKRQALIFDHLRQKLILGPTIEQLMASPTEDSHAEIVSVVGLNIVP